MKHANIYTADTSKQVYLTAEHATDLEMVQTLLFGFVKGRRANAISNPKTKAAILFFDTAIKASKAKTWAMLWASEKGRDLTGII